MQTESEPLISIVVVSHKQIKMVERMLTSLTEHHPHHNFEIFVIENVSNQPGISSHFENIPLTYLKNRKKRGFSDNVNFAYQQIHKNSNYFCILNPDIIFKADIFSELISILEAGQLDIIAPVMIDQRGIVQDTFRPVPGPKEIFQRYFSKNKRKVSLANETHIIRPDWIAGMFMLMPVQIFSSVGGFDPRYKLYFEDVDFCIRAKQKEIRIGVVQGSAVIHEAQRTSHRNLIFLLKHILSAAKFFSSDVYHSYRNSTKN